MLLSVDAALAKEYDYVICGGGTAGLCIAARLTEDPNVTVLVLEAGQANLGDPAILGLMTYQTHFKNPKYDWAFETAPQKACDGQVYPWSRGKGLGGSSAINFFVWTKPHAAELDDLERLGNPGWNWKNMNKYALRAEKFTAPLADDVEKHKLVFEVPHGGSEGMLHTAFPSHVLEYDLEIQKTLQARGIPLAPSPLGGNPTGTFFCPNTRTQTHTRSYAATAYYEPNAERPNFNVLLEAIAGRVITESGSDGLLNATGVEFLHAGTTHLVKAKKEVILCAGCLKTPQLLELSGIGNRAVLEKAGIPVKLDLMAVGENIQEHYYTNISWELKDDVPFDTFDVLGDPEVAMKHLELLKEKKGLFTAGVMGISFVPLDLLSPRAATIREQMTERVRANADKYPPGLKEQYDIQIERLERGAPACELMASSGCNSGPNRPEPKKKYLTMGAGVNHPFARGTIHAVSSNPMDAPTFDPKYFEEDADLQTLLEEVKFVRQLIDVEPLKNLVVREHNPGPTVQTDEDLAKWIRQTMITTYHTCGGASMLPKDKGGVVDAQLKVYGTSNLRVADLSILPLHFAAHPVANTYGIAEQAADIIKGKFVV